MKTIYLDNSATTEISVLAKEKMIETMDIFGNPSSIHSVGLEANKLLIDARAKISKTLGVSNLNNSNLIFTSCGSEADSTAIFGVAYAKKRRDKNRIISTDSEHPAVENALKRLEEDGFDVIRLTTKNGVIDFDEFKSAINDKTLLISMMMVNNETGAFYDIKKCFEYAKKNYPDCVTHTDAVQGYLKVKFKPSEIYADLISLSAHKIHGPKGVGALYINPEIIKKKAIRPFLVGGGQEFGFRSGTENIIGIVGFAYSAEEGHKNLNSNIEKMTELRDYAQGLLKDTGVKFNIPEGCRAPHILNITLPNIKSETMLHFLSSYGICVSAGSACSSHSKHTSQSLLAFGLASNEADCSLRISLSEYNEKSDIDEFAKVLKNGIDTLVKIQR